MPPPTVKPVVVIDWANVPLITKVDTALLFLVNVPALCAKLPCKLNVAALVPVVVVMLNVPPEIFALPATFKVAAPDPVPVPPAIENVPADIFKLPGIVNVAVPVEAVLLLIARMPPVRVKLPAAPIVSVPEPAEPEPVFIINCPPLTDTFAAVVSCATVPPDVPEIK